MAKFRSLSRGALEEGRAGRLGCPCGRARTGGGAPAHALPRRTGRPYPRNARAPSGPPPRPRDQTRVARRLGGPCSFRHARADDGLPADAADADAARRRRLPGKEIVTRRADGSFHRTNYREVMRRSKQLAVALDGLGLERGDRVATLCWNHSQHLEATSASRAGGRAPHAEPPPAPDDIAFIANDAGDRVVVVDDGARAAAREVRRRDARSSACSSSEAR